MSNTTQTISDLVEDLTPIGRPPNFGRVSAYWWIFATLATAGIMLLVAPFRTGFSDQLITSPRFALESLLGFAVCAGLARAAFELGIPDSRSHWWRARYVLLLLALWIVLFVVAVQWPVLPPSMAGKREHCFMEVAIYAAPLTVAGMLLIRRMMPLHPTRTGVWLGVAAGLIPAHLMQWACMHEPWHIISRHLLPVILAAILGACLGLLFLNRKAG